jgi:predicted transcriptional regulator
MEDTIEYGTDTKLSAVIRVRCTPEMKERVERYARRTIGDPSDHVRKAIEEYLAERDPQDQQLNTN